LQGAMFHCSAWCYEDSTATMQQVQQCIKQCHVPLAQAQAIVTAKLEHFQPLHCNDKAKDALEAGGMEARVRGQLDACLAACGDDHLRLVPAMAKKMKDSLAALQQ
ncbi:F136A protein, partial [Mesembrinibis cayennensis]|nr:F136A protein [Mesembrinibis cayennensis]